MSRAELVDGFAVKPRETVDGAEMLIDAVFGKPRRKPRKGSRQS